MPPTVDRQKLHDFIDEAAAKIEADMPADLGDVESALKDLKRTSPMAYHLLTTAFDYKAIITGYTPDQLSEAWLDSGIAIYIGVEIQHRSREFIKP